MGFSATPSSFCSAIHFILQSAPPTILPDPIINVITVSPKIWRKKVASNYKPLVYNDVDEDFFSFKPFGKCVKRSASWESRLRFDLIHWNESLDSLELERYFLLEIKMTTPLGAPFYLLSNPIGILSMKGALHVQCSISNSVLTQGIPPLFVVASRSTDTTKRK